VSYSIHRGAEQDLSEACRFYRREAGNRLARRFLNAFCRSPITREKMEAWCFQPITSVLRGRRVAFISDLISPTGDSRTTRIRGNLRVCLSPGRATIRLNLQWRKHQPLPESALRQSLYAASERQTTAQLWATGGGATKAEPREHWKQAATATVP
jgi:hypothetical protein